MDHSLCDDDKRDIIGSEVVDAIAVAADENHTSTSAQQLDSTSRFGNCGVRSVTDGTSPHFSSSHHILDMNNDDSNDEYSVGRYSAMTNVVATTMTITTPVEMSQHEQQQQQPPGYNDTDHDDDDDEYGVFVDTQQLQNTTTVTSAVTTSIVNSELPSTAKRVLLRYGGTDTIHSDHDDSTNDNDENQSHQNDSVHEMNHCDNRHYRVVADGADSPSAAVSTTATTTTTTADVEQSRSVSLIHKLRQSAFRRKMNSNIDRCSSHTTTAHNNSSHSTASHNTIRSPAFAPSPVSLATNPTTMTTTASDDNARLWTSPTSVCDNSTPPPQQPQKVQPPVLPLSILKHHTNNTIDTNTNIQNDLSPRSLVVGRLEDGLLNIRSPNTTTIEDTIILIDEIGGVPTELDEDQSPADSLMMSDSSLEGDFDSHSEMMISASSIVSDTIPTTSTNSIAQTTMDIGASSMAFIQQLRGAAVRRKMHLTRSRDSLLNKERQHHEHNAARRQQREEMERQQRELLLQQQEEEEQKRMAHQQMLTHSHGIPFKALPLPKSTGQLHGGLVGVPKVEKRPPTIPISPHLGPRRLLRTIEPSSNINRPVEMGGTGRWTNRRPEAISNFKALPIPKSSLPMGGAGQAGIPKVPKRMVTIPQSPVLGLLRRQPPKSLQTVLESRLQSRSDQTPILDPIAKVSVLTASSASTPSPRLMRMHPVEYIPHSTRRAEQRAEFEQRRIVHEQQRIEHERQEQRQLVKRLQGELQRLRIEI